MEDDLGSVILVLLCIPVSIVVATGYYLWARERDLERQAQHRCTHCGVLLSRSVAAVMCDECERGGRLTSAVGYHLVLAMGIALIGVAVILAADGSGYASWGGIIVGSVGGARALVLAGYIKRRIASGRDG